MVRKRRSQPGTASIRVPIMDEEYPALAQDDHVDEVKDLHSPAGGGDDGNADVPTYLHDWNEGGLVDSLQSSKIHSQETDNSETIKVGCGSAGASRKERCNVGYPSFMNKGYETGTTFLDGSEPSVRKRKSKGSPKKISEMIKSASYEDFETFCAMQEEETEFGKATYIGRNYVPSTQEVLDLIQCGAPVTCEETSGICQKKKNRKSSSPVDEKNKEGKTSGHGQQYLILLAVFVVLLPLCLFFALPMYFMSTHDSYMQEYIRAEREGRWADIPLEYRDEVITKSGRRYSKHLLKFDDPRWALDVTYAEREHRNRDDKSDMKLLPSLERGTKKKRPQQRKNQAGIAKSQKIQDVVHVVVATAARGFSLTLNSIMEKAATICQGAGAVVATSCSGVTRFVTSGYSTDNQVFKFVMKGMKAYWRRGYNAERKIIKLLVNGSKMEL
ncbi:hypothetical protein E2C01_059328 [Portunus trituberculatus]|uniref:Uncharacterized protein n=1 Tax=Portunus trituberculatus TaxID=210409 RepID=A0A5B7H799_PORTR|nr:hypothetical protein [Portunus trituberculatus]